MLSAVAVDYGITPLGWSLSKPFVALYDWTQERLPLVEAARERFDRVQDG